MGVACTPYLTNRPSHLHPALDDIDGIDAHPRQGSCQPSCQELHQRLRRSWVPLLLLLLLLLRLLHWCLLKLLLVLVLML